MNLQSGYQSTFFSSLRLPSALATVRGLSFALTLEIFVLITLGGLVRNAGAGLACPDWPLCYGQVVPPMNSQIFLEWFHRLMAGSVSVCLLALSAIIFLKAELRRPFGMLCALAVCLLMAQVVLGGLTVLGLLSPKWVSSHLAVAMGFFGTVLWLTLALRENSDKAPASSLPGFARLAALVTGVFFVQVLLGALVSANYAGLACLDFPTCNGSLIPPFEGLVRFQFLHRVGAVIATLAVALLCAAGISKGVSRRARAALRVLPALLTLQVCLGVGSVVFKLPLLVSVAHLGTAAALFGMLLVTTYEVRRS